MAGRKDQAAGIIARILEKIGRIFQIVALASLRDQFLKGTGFFSETIFKLASVVDEEELMLYSTKDGIK